MTMLVWLAIGASIGLAAAAVLRIDTNAARLLNIAAGIAGALAGGLAEGRGSIRADPWDITSLIVAAACAVILVGIVNLFRRSAVG